MFSSVIKRAAVGAVLVAAVASPLSVATAGAGVVSTVVTVSGGSTHYVGSTYTLSVDVGANGAAVLYAAHDTLDDRNAMLLCGGTSALDAGVYAPAGSAIATCAWTPTAAGTYYVYAAIHGGTDTTTVVTVNVTAAPPAAATPSTGSSFY
ncbi:hypothetical protein ACFROC_10860 [Nocardia tengchongensis]|uniref:hypothetical protein n=1 Tax=Nocardia tengchongensis TaxID=2055889 RepID=UPI00367EEB5B